MAGQGNVFSWMVEQSERAGSAPVSRKGKARPRSRDNLEWTLKFDRKIGGEDAERLRRMTIQQNHKSSAATR